MCRASLIRGKWFDSTYIGRMIMQLRRSFRLYSRSQANTIELGYTKAKFHCMTVHVVA